MGANEAPEKIYIQSFNVSEEDAKFERKLYFDDVWTEEPESGQENIEYTRTDAFIEKALKFLDGCIPNYIELTHANVDTVMDVDNEGFIKDFINYMKGK